MKSTRELNARLREQYGRSRLAEIILEQLDRAGKDINALTRQDLATFEEFHLRGRRATRELAQLADLQHGMRVLDVGSGLAGPARTLVDEFGCLVTGIDIAWEYCRAAHTLNVRTGFSSRITTCCGQAQTLPFPAGVFDVVWMQHVSMNVEQKESLIEELSRVLIPGGRLAFYEILAGSLQHAFFPLPWADDPGISFLIDAPAFRQILKSNGFKVLRWEDVTASTLEWGRHALVYRTDRPPPFGLDLVIGEDVAEKTANLLRNLEEERVTLVQAVLELQA
jgi:ubiquinone/menaquinone biosynthesis C-methylase UbiE